MGLLVKLCYRNHDCNSGVVGHQYENAKVIAIKNYKTIKDTYDKNGRIKDSLFISENDWKIFTKFFIKKIEYDTRQENNENTRTRTISSKL